MPYSVYILVTVIWAKQKLIVPAVALMHLGCVVVGSEFFSMAVDYDAPSNFQFFQIFDVSFVNVQLLAGCIPSHFRSFLSM